MQQTFIQTYRCYSMALPNNGEAQVRMSKEYSLTEREYQLLLEGASEMDEYYGFQARFVILVAGRLGLRAGEITHMKESWIDWRDSMIKIPRQEDCTKGKNGGPCGYCRQKAKQRVEHADDPLSLEVALDYQWVAKTRSASRSVPFDFDPRAQLVIERFFEKYDEWPVSRQAVNRRVNSALEKADGLNVEDTNPHGLRATAASYHAGRGLDAIPLQALLGWSQLSTARNYVKISGENTARALRQIHSR